MYGVAEVDIQGYIKDFTRSRLWTARLVRQFTDAELDLRPAEGSLSTREQILQIRQSDNLVVSLLTDLTPNPASMKNPHDVSTISASLTSLKEGLAAVTRAAEQVSPEMLLEEVEPFGPQWRMTRGQLLYLMIDHESHHRGQLTVYLRVAGKVPPVIWEPVDEKVFDLNT